MGEGLLPIDAQLVFQVEIGGGQKNMEPGMDGGFDGAQGGVHIFLTGAREGGHFAAADFAGNRADCFQISRRCDGKPRFDHVDAKLFELARQAKLFLPVHREAG